MRIQKEYNMLIICLCAKFMKFPTTPDPINCNSGRVTNFVILRIFHDKIPQPRKIKDCTFISLFQIPNRAYSTQYMANNVLNPNYSLLL